MNRTVVVVDYGVGNLHSVVKALRHEGADVEVSDDPAHVLRAERVLLPGVGAFGDGAAGLRARGLEDALKAFARSGRPLMGICLGMQLLMSSSEEFGHHEGLALLPGSVVRITPGGTTKVPHVGWNRVRRPSEARWADTPLRDLPPVEAMYFVHSFAPVPTREEDIVCTTTYGESSFASAVGRDNVFGVQFHPEKSGPVGLQLLRGFISWRD